ncbi:hypothetical protein [Gemmatimonas groenlandica]|uniref:Type II secretion system protein GspC N-terminal domain-containing protein n=1 Tax=Gemmatimonas groenlandica TaxID=2732249 RepID=A0A6M4ITS2_9BACT|nr:hypothetical protein [Gemmatimonas groenlandica]QJR35661.1 hypothetical protein HKW67_09135 [Gemmatimonas groenlandica]
MSATNRWRGYQALDVLSAVCGVIALVMLLLPASTTVAPDSLRVATASSASVGPTMDAAPSTGTVVDSLAHAIVRTNAFSASRQEPRARFVAPGSEPAPAAPIYEPAGNAFAVSDIDAGPKLFGIVSVGGTPRALLQLRTSAEPPRLLGVGESFGGVRVVRIAGDRVVISSSSGTRTLRLSRVVSDSSENVP